MTLENRIEPWEEYPPTLFGQGSRLTDPKGTVVHYEGVTLRARGGYEDRLAAALITARRHMVAEGYLP